jgi:two-component system NarL family sensor kinase
MGDRDRANAYFLEAIARADEEGDRMGRIMTHYYFLDSNINQLDAPYFKPYLDVYLELVGDGDLRIDDDTYHVPLLLNQLPHVERIPLMRKAVEAYHETGISRSTLFFNRLLVESYLAVDDNVRALSATSRGLELAKTANETVYVMDYHRMLADQYRQEGRYDAALRHHESYYTMRDSLLTAAMRKHMDSLNVRYETARKEAHIAEQALQIEARTHQRNMLLIAVAGLLWFGTFLVLYFWNRNRLTRRLALQEAQMNQQRIAQLEQEKQLLAMHSMIEGQEAERLRIAQDLHDGLGGLLGTVKAHFSVIQQHIDELESIDVYRKVDKLIDTASQEVRRISHNMAPHALRFGGLKDALDDLVLQFRKQGLAVQLDWNGTADRLPEKTEVMLFRIAQELTNNVVKHAHAKTLMIQVVRSEEQLTLTVEDDGRGFEEDKLENGLGLQSIRSRVTYLNGSLDILSEYDVGTTVTVQIPLAAE